MDNHPIYEGREKEKKSADQQPERWKALRLLTAPSVLKHIMKQAYSLLTLTRTSCSTYVHFHADKYVH